MNISPVQIQSAISGAGGASRPQQPTSGGESFGAMLQSLASQAVQDIKASESTSIAALQGQASVQEVVMKTLAAEQSLQAAIAVRDKLLSALNDVNHMQI